ncbi:MAG: S-methyl-5'-thioadenosine phosphorylase [Nitrospirae bacterium]|nr:MAG: S-methyl-5'-thioadenosine phosphorylase [Nitrospirota bacterium]
MRTKPRAEIGIIGGSGLYQMEGLKHTRTIRVATPFGRPSDEILVGDLEGRTVAFLSRHGRGHRLAPSFINYRANIYALKTLGVTRVFSVSAVGSMKESIRPGDLVVPDQFVDRTSQRPATFFDQDVVVHVAFADPVCKELSAVLWEAAQAVPATVHRPGTYLCIEGPQFSSRAESAIYRQWGVDVIGMTNIPEAKLAREAEMCYATLALVTDYDCWHETEEAVSVGAILDIMRASVDVAKQVLRTAVAFVSSRSACPCQQALEHAVVTDPASITATAKKRYRVLLHRWLNRSNIHPSPERSRHG